MSGAQRCLLLGLAVMLSIAAPSSAAATGNGVASLAQGQVARKAKADLWTHTEGGPRGQKVGLDLPEGENEEVMKIVEAKKVDIAAAGLHQATVMESQANEKKERSDEEDETEVIAAKIADTKVDRLRKQINDLDESVSKYKDQLGEFGVKHEEDKAAMEMSSAKKKEGLAAALKLTEAKVTNARTKLDDAQQKIQKLAMQVVDAKEESNLAHAKHQHTRLNNVALRVSLQAAKDKVTHAKYMKLRSQNMKVLAEAKLTKELDKKKVQQGKNDVKGAKEMLAIMSSGPGNKEAKASLDRATKRYTDSKKAWEASTKKVDKVKNKVLDAETQWVKKVAYKRMMKTARVGHEANEAEKAFRNALTEADKRSKAASLQQTQKELKEAEKNADKAEAEAKHVEFDAQQDKKWRKDKFKEEQMQLADNEKKKGDLKKDDDMAKAALSGTGKPPER